MYGVILVSHSKKITDGIKEMIEEMTGESENVKIFSCGGTDDGRMGTNSLTILNTIQKNENAKRIFIFADIGSAILSTEMAIDLLDNEEIEEKVLFLENIPLVEGAFAASIQASAGSSVEDILEELENV